MDNENKEDVFSLKLNEEGRSSLYRYLNLVRYFTVLGWIFSVVIIVRDAFLLFQDYSYYQDSFLRMYYQLYPFGSLIATAAFLFQLIYVSRTGKKMRSALQHHDEKQFNLAFRYFNLSLFTAIIITVISLLMVAADMCIIFFFQ